MRGLMILKIFISHRMALQNRILRRLKSIFLDRYMRLILLFITSVPMNPIPEAKL